MKYQNFAIIFVIILLPISIVLSYYIQTQTDTLVLQTTYQTKLNDSTYDAISAYQMNSLNTQRVSGESVKSYVLASVNTFFTTLATNMGMSSASKSSFQSYIPAILFTTYDGYYIYSPTKVPKVAAYPEDGRTIITEKGEVVYCKKNVTVDATLIDTIKATDGSINVPDGNSYFTTNPNDSSVQIEYNYMLKPFIYYSAQYKAADYDFVASYTLDNYVTLYGKRDISKTSDYGKDSATDEFSKSGYLIDPSKVELRRTNFSKRSS